MIRRSSMYSMKGMWCLLINVRNFRPAFCCLMLITAQQPSSGMAQPLHGPQHCDEVCEFSPWAKHAYCGERALSEIPAICRQVKTLDVRLNNIGALRRGGFSQFGNLKYLYLDDNGMRQVENGAFEGCSTLQLLSWGGNNIGVLTKDILRGLPNLMFMRTPESCIHTIERETFEQTPLLETLDLTGNNLVSPPCDAFTATNVLKKLYISGNTISVIPESCFAHLQLLENLKLSSNPLRDVRNVSAFQGLSSLKKLEMANTSLRAVPVMAFSHVQKIEHLILEHNLVSGLQGRDFSTLLEVEFLNLASNRIVTIHSRAFEGMKRLKVLVLSNNHIASIGQFALLPVESTLEQVHLHDNHLMSTHNISSSTILSLDKLLLARNPLQCHCRLHAVRLWLVTNPQVSAHPDGNATCLAMGDETVSILDSPVTQTGCPVTRPSRIPGKFPDPSPGNVEALTTMHSKVPQEILEKEDSNTDVDTTQDFTDPALYVVIALAILTVAIMILIFIIIVLFNLKWRLYWRITHYYQTHRKRKAESGVS